MSEKSNYEKRGVSADKKDVHAAIKNVDKGIFPRAFAKVIPDLFGGDPNWCNILHADGAGTKTSLAYLYWKETGDLSVWRGVVQDSIVMNLDDMIAVGATDVPIILSGTIGRNKYLIPGEVIDEIINGTEEFLQKMRDLGINIVSNGGETADIGDLVRTIVIDNTLATRMPRKDVISIDIQPGDFIVGLSSIGQATYEDAYNGGMGSNGLTGSRHDVFFKDYIQKYPETFDPILLETCPDLVYKGRYDVIDNVTKVYGDVGGLDVGKLVLSPTRTYAPIIKKVLDTVSRDEIGGIIHCSGGGQTKVLHFAENVHIIKDNLFPMPPLFELIRECGDYHADRRKEMYQNFNMGHRMELYVHNKEDAYVIVGAANLFGVDAKIIGRVEASDTKKLTIKDDWGEFVY